MFIDKNGKMASNVGAPVKVFETQSDYEAWVASLPTGSNEDDFLVIHKYQVEVGSYCQAETLNELKALPAVMKRPGVLYGATTEKKLYFYDTSISDFVNYT